MRILHTGDFRYDRKEIGLSMLKERLVEKHGEKLFPIDYVYLDTTYLRRDYCFMSQQEALSKASGLLKRYAAGEKILVLFGTYLIGKEKVFVRLLDELVEKEKVIEISVSAEKLRVYNCLDFGLLHDGFDERFAFLKGKEKSRFHVVSMQKLKFERMVQFM